MALLELKNVNKIFVDNLGWFRKQTFYAVQDASFTLEPQQTLAIIGENGAGKSTLAKMIVGMVEPSSGEILFKNKPLTFGDYRFRAKHIRMVFQDSNDAFDQNHNIGQILDAPLRLATDLNEEERNARIFRALKWVGMYPEHTLIPISAASNGQKQRVALARALMLSPEILVVDDTQSTLDFSVKTQQLNLMLQLQKTLNLAYIYIGQHLGIIKHTADKLIVMHEGKIEEYGNTRDVLLNPQSPITARLIESHFGQPLTPEAWLSRGSYNNPL